MPLTPTLVTPTPADATVVTRRSFLKGLGLGAAATLVVADGLLAYRAYDQGVLAEGEGPAFRAWRAWRDGQGPEAHVGAALLAASAHNTQPWLFAVGDRRIDLYADRSRATGANDALDRELYVSLGCALENLLLSAAARGDAPAAHLPAAGGDLVATVALGQGRPSPSPLYDAIPARRSNRSAYTGAPVPVAHLDAMSALVDDGGARLVWLTEPAARQRYGELMVDAARAHAADDEQSRASFAWWRSDWDAIQRHNDGLTIDGVGLQPLVRTVGKILPAVSRSAADRTFVERTGVQTRTAAMFGVVVVDDPWSRQSQLDGGRLLQRLHLWATANDVGFQHMNQVTEQVDRDRQLGRASRFESALTDLVGPGALVSFRLGTPTVAAIRSPRRPISEVQR